MDTFSTRIIKFFQDYKTKKLLRLGEFLVAKGISANFITMVSLIFGLLAVYFLFENNLLFFIFILLNLIADGLDGILARLDKISNYGEFFDHIVNDGFITVLLVLKIGYHLGDYYAYIAGGLYLFVLLNHAISKFKAPLIFMRLSAVIGISSSIIISSAGQFLLTLTYLSVAITSAYSLARQLQWYLMKNKDY